MFAESLFRFARLFDRLRPGGAQTSLDAPAAARAVAPARAVERVDALEPVRITIRPSRRTTECWVEDISREHGSAEVRLVMADGTTASTSLLEEEVDWLELGVNQIVHLSRGAADQRARSASDPGVGLVRECVDLGG